MQSISKCGKIKDTILTPYNVLNVLIYIYHFDISLCRDENQYAVERVNGLTRER